MNNLWFRPTALSLSDYATISREALMELYRQDNENAAENGVSIPSRPTTATTTTLRVCQWNVHYFLQSHDHHTTTKTTYNQIYDELLRHNADVLVLQEFCTVDWVHENLPFLQRLQKRGGFAYTRVAATWYPTAVFVKPGMVVTAVDCMDDFALDMDRRAIVMRLTLCHVPQATTTAPQQKEEGNDDTTKTRHVWIYGTHLHHVEDFPGRRYAEMETLLRHVKQHCSADDDDAVLIVGDFNQQRSRDYTATEWNNIVANKKQRDEDLVPIQDDDVAATTTESTTTSDATTTNKSTATAATAHRCVTTLLEQAGFTSVWDNPSHKNWPQQEPPPATHWSGTVIDYTYARGKSLKNVGTYVSRAGWSDHRLIVTDWEVF